LNSQSLCDRRVGHTAFTITHSAKLLHETDASDVVPWRDTAHTCGWNPGRKKICTLSYWHCQMTITMQRLWAFFVAPLNYPDLYSYLLTALYRLDDETGRRHAEMLQQGDKIKRPTKNFIAVLVSRNYSKLMLNYPLCNEWRWYESTRVLASLKSYVIDWVGSIGVRKQFFASCRGTLSICLSPADNFTELLLLQPITVSLEAFPL